MPIPEPVRFCWVSVGLLLLSGMVEAGDLESSAKLPPRPLWTTSRVVGFPDPPPPYRVEQVYSGVELTKPLAAGHFPESHLMWAATHQKGYAGPGRIHQFADEAGVSEATVFLERPEIIYGLAFHPRFDENGYLFIGCNGRSNALGEKATRVLRFTLSRNPPFRCDPQSALVIIEWPSNGHNGGDLTFGSDGMLYVSAGDGTSDSDPKLAGQDLATLNGSILRIDVNATNGDAPYSIPPDNPFADTPGARSEIWAYGLRNPWRISFDHPSGQLWAGNNGQDLWETVHLIRRGENYGWSVTEGGHPFQLERPRGPTPIVPPTIEHAHSEARSLTGGFVYRGDVLPELIGAYVYGDYSTGNIWGARHDGERLADHRLLARTALQITGFGRDSRGDLLIVDHAGGVYRLVPRPPESERPRFPRLLSETGLFASVRDHEPHPGLIPYSVNSPLWSDGAAKQRFIALPGDAKIAFHLRKGWGFEDGAVLVKTFSLPAARESRHNIQRIETRLLMKQNGEWFGYSYRWNDEQTDAVLVDASGSDDELAVCDPATGLPTVQTWHFPSRSECMVCHTRATNFVLGLNVAQMNRMQTYGDMTTNQLAALADWGVFDPAQSKKEHARPAAEFELPKPSGQLSQLANPEDASQPLQLRARSYLHANCANCHVPAGGGNSLMNLAYSTPLEKMRIIDVPPQHDRLGVDQARLVAPGDPARSILLQRLSCRGRGQMPPLATNRVDDRGVAIIREWITALGSSVPED